MSDADFVKRRYHEEGIFKYHAEVKITSIDNRRPIPPKIRAVMEDGWEEFLSKVDKAFETYEQESVDS